MPKGSLPQIKRIHELEKLIKKHQKLYYEGQSEISDVSFDEMWDELKILDPENEIFSVINSETTDGFPKEYHLIPMGSQEKAGNPESFAAWAKKVHFSEYLVQYKLDGASLELQYENGLFSKAVTRGDGRIGDDITENAKKMKGLVFTLPSPFGPDDAQSFSGGIRCEVIMTHQIHQSYFSQKANCRNAANGLMKRKDGRLCEHLQVICYDAATGMPGSPFTGKPPYIDEEDKILWLQKCGFFVVPMKMCYSVDEVTTYRAHVMDIRESLAYDIDGLVIKGRDIDPIDLTRSRPEKQIAYKFSLEESISTLREVQWSESGVTYTPIAIIDPVQLAGTVVQRANLSNPNMIASLGLKIGSRVVVTKRGEIIPKIESLVENPHGCVPIVQPKTCSQCGEFLQDDGSRLFCPNLQCPKLIHHRLEKWISVLDIRDFGITLLERLFKSGRLTSVSSIYTLKESELASLDRMGDLSAAKVIRSIKSKQAISLSSFVAGFDIDGIGETMVEKLLEAGFDSLEKLLTASMEDFSSVNQFGDILAHNLHTGLQTLADEMRFLVSSGTIKILPVSHSSLLSGISVCFTGELETMKRSDAEKKVKELGGTIKSSVVKGLSVLVTNQPSSNSLKNIRARELSIPLFSEKDFLSLCENGKSMLASSALPELPESGLIKGQMEFDL